MFSNAQIKQLNNKMCDFKFKNIKYNIDDYEILSDTGWKDINYIGQTIEYETWKIKTESGLVLKCADTHIVFDENGDEIYVKDCIPYQTKIKTKNGIEKIVYIKNLNQFDNMYDLNVDGHRYYSNSILSHNTTICGGYILWYSIFREGKTSGIVSNKQVSAKEVLSRIKNMYELLPSWIKPGVKNYEQTFVIFENGSRLISAATSKNSFRGWSINGILLADEFAHVHKNLQHEFWSSNYPTISASKKAKIIIISTPNGINDLFHEIYTKSEKKQNTFKNISVKWAEHPERDEKWLQEQRDILGEQLFKQEILTHFLGSTNLVIDPVILEKLLINYKEPIHYDLNNTLRIYEKPIDNCLYVIGVDCAKGTGEHYSTCQIIKIKSINPIDLEQVAVFESNIIDTYDFSEIINRLSIYYNNSYILVENNAEGNSVVTELHWTHENMGLVSEGTKKNKLGIRATKTTKPQAVMLMKRLIENFQLKLYDKKTIKQLTDFQEKNNNIFKCENLNDDLVSALYWSTWILKMDILDETASFNIQKEETEDVWGILTGYETSKEDWSWI